MFERWLSFSPTRSILIIGPRRCGKTTFVRKTFPDFKYVTLDDFDYLDWAKRDPKGLVKGLGPTAIIDEIQRMPHLTVAVKHEIDNSAARFVMTGSSSLGLLDAAADSLAGRIEIHSLPTACWGEDDGQPDHSIFIDRLALPDVMRGARLLERAMEYGQFPEVLTASDEGDMHATLRSYRDSYFTRDLAQLSNIENLEGLRAIFFNLARSLGSHVDVSGFARESGLSHPTTTKYLNTLAQSQLTFKISGYRFGPAKRHIKAAKTYFCDNAIVHGFGAQISRGQLVENFVIAELEKRRKLGMIDCEHFFYYKSVGGREIDLVFRSGGTLNAVEIKAGSKLGRSDFRGLREFRAGMEEDVRCFLFYNGTEYDTVDGIEMIPIAALYRGK